jgi:ubiquinone/menaquinone biosynthesis C-methylase UbiE
MGSKTIQSKLWGQRPADWATFQEKTGDDGYNYVLAQQLFKPGNKLLDVGCGSGLFSSLVHARGTDVTGIDATGELIAEAKKRDAAINFLTGEMEELPFDDKSFDFVCGFNSYQYAANVKNAFLESKRVLKDDGKLIIMIWGNKADCEAATYLKAVGSLLPPPPPGAAGPFALSENQLLETLLLETGFNIIHHADVPGIWNYNNKEDALKGLLSAGPAARAIAHSGFDQAYATVAEAVTPYVQPDGRVIYHNKNRIVIAEKFL